MKKQLLAEINPTIEYMVEHVIDTIEFFKNISSYKIGIVNFPELVLQKFQNQLGLNVELLDLENHFNQDVMNTKNCDLILALYSGNVYNFLKFLSRMQLFGAQQSGLLICGLLQNSCESLKEIGIVDLQILDYQKLIDDILNVGYVEPVVTLDYLTLEYTNFELLITDLKCFFAHTGLSELLDENENFIKDRFNQYVKTHKLFALDLDLYFACAFNNHQVVKNPLKTEQIKLQEVFFKGKAIR